jgi:hypothetical protein
VIPRKQEIDNKSANFRKQEIDTKSAKSKKGIE